MAGSLSSAGYAQLRKEKNDMKKAGMKKAGKGKAGKKWMAALLAVGCLFVAGCGKGADSRESGQAAGEKKTYQNTYAGVEFASYSYHSGFMSAVCESGGESSYTVTLEVDGENYTLTKEIIGPEDPMQGNDVNLQLKFVFYGTCTAKWDGYTLSVPEKCEWSEDWKGLATNEQASMGGFKNGSGTVVSEEDCTETGDNVMAIFNGEYLYPSESGVAEQTVHVSDGKIVF